MYVLACVYMCIHIDILAYSLEFKIHQLWPRKALSKISSIKISLSHETVIYEAKHLIGCTRNK